MQDPRPQMVKTKTVLAKTKTLKNGRRTKTDLETFITELYFLFVGCQTFRQVDSGNAGEDRLMNFQGCKKPFNFLYKIVSAIKNMTIVSSLQIKTRLNMTVIIRSDLCHCFFCELEVYFLISAMLYRYCYRYRFFFFSSHIWCHQISFYVVGLLS